MSLVNLIVYAHIGDQTLDKTLELPILLTFLRALQLSMFFVAVALLLSMLRGRVPQLRP